jgi:uridine kinase
MKDDKIFIKEWHRRAARAIFENILNQIGEKFVISIGGESGSGKSEIALALKELLEAHTIHTGILQADDYFIYMSQTCDTFRRKCLDLVGPGEVKLDFIDCHLRSFKQGVVDLYKPVAVYQEAKFYREVLPVEHLQVLIVEGVYCTLLEFADTRIFIDRDFRDTIDDRRNRGRDLMDKFTEKILEIEHKIVREHKQKAQITVFKDGTIHAQ